MTPTRTPPACPRHRDLVDQALGPDPSDSALEQYAAEIPGCEDCRRLLAIRVSAHPERFSTPSPTFDGLRGMAELAAALETPDRRSVWTRVAPIAVAIGLAAAAAAVVALQPGDPATPVQATPSSPAPASVAEGPSEGVAPAPVPVAVPRTPRPSLPAPPELVVAPDAVVAQVDDWPVPPFEELRRGEAKGAPGPVRSVELVVSGAHGVGDAVGLTIVSSTDTELAVCVDGPERGVVWRGGVPAGRTSLTRSGAEQRFAFSAPGRYRFLVSTDPAGCSAPVHVVEVEVGG